MLLGFKSKGYQMGRTRDTYEVFLVEPEVKEPLGSTSCRWEDNIRIGLNAVGWESVGWIYLA
jgi:hypothetical protein